MNQSDAEDRSQAGGCLGSLLSLLGLRLQPPEIEPQQQLPYRLTQRFLSPAELSFFKVVQQVIPPEFTILAKPRIGDILFVPRGTRGKWAFENKIRSKHVDFLVCEVQTMTPRLVIELDDRSHQRPDRQDRDAFVDEAMAAAGLALVHIAAQAKYVVADLQALLLKHLQPVVRTTQAKQTSDSQTPVCPNCDVQMVQRVASKGRHKGSSF